MGSAVWIAAASQRTAAALQEAETSLALAESHYRQARSAVDHFGGSVADRLAGLPGADRLRHGLLSDTLTYYQEFLRTANRDTNLRNDLAATHFKSGVIAHRMGDIAGSRRGYEQAVSAWRGLAASQGASSDELQSLLALGLRCLAGVESEAGRIDQAMGHFTESIAVSEALARDAPRDPRHDSAVAEALASRGVARHHAGDTVAGIEDLKKAVARFETALASDPDRAGDLRALAVTHSNLSDLSPGNVARRCLHARRAGARNPGAPRRGEPR